MPDRSDPRVAVYLDFDNIVMSWYDRVHGRSAYSRDRQRIAQEPIDPEIGQRLAEATIDAGMLVVEVGIAPVKPAEFVVFRISQKKQSAA
jgi:hypothetical protein